MFILTHRRLLRTSSGVAVDRIHACVGIRELLFSMLSITGLICSLSFLVNNGLELRIL